jgi:hypothetical protein
MAQTLNNLNLNAQLGWSVSNSNGASYSPSGQSGSTSFSLAGLNLTNFPTFYSQTFALTSAGSTVVNLMNLTNFFGGTFAFTNVLGYWLQNISATSSGVVQFSANSASDPALLNFASSASTAGISLNTGDIALWSEVPSAVGYAITTTQSKLLLNNTGGVAQLVQLSLWGA